MPKSKRNPFTGRLRRQPERYTTRNRRSQALDSTDVVDSQSIQQLLAHQAFLSNTGMLALSLNAAKANIARGSGESTERLDDMVLLNGVCCVACLLNFNYLLFLDSLIMDMSIDEEIEDIVRMEERWTRIDDFKTDDQARCFTNFTMDELHQLCHFFGLPTNVRVQIGSPHRQDAGHCVFHREHLLIYTLIKTGETKAFMADQVTGGDARKWSYGYRFMVKYLDQRYKHVIGAGGLRKFTKQFPLFAERIRLAVAREGFHADRHHFEDGGGFDPANFRVVGFVDTKDYRVSSPAGDYDGAMRSRGSYLAQRNAYSGHAKQHGVRVVSVLLPNGLTGAVWGPVSSRSTDPHILQTFDLDQSIRQLQEQELGPIHGLFGFYGDCAYRGPCQCIVSRHEGLPGIPLTERQIEENRVMKKVMASVEWSYGQVENLWKLSEQARNYELDGACSDPCHASAYQLLYLPPRE